MSLKKVARGSLFIVFMFLLFQHPTVVKAGQNNTQNNTVTPVDIKKTAPYSDTDDLEKGNIEPKKAHRSLYSNFLENKKIKEDKLKNKPHRSLHSHFLENKNKNKTTQP